MVRPWQKVRSTGLRVVDLSTTLTSATVSGFLADFGADVVAVEPPGGSPLRTQPAFPFWGRGKRSIALDLPRPPTPRWRGRSRRGADVVIETFRPGVVERFGLGYDDLAPVNPRLVYASVTAFGRTGELADVKGYEGLVMARIGGHDSDGRDHRAARARVLRAAVHRVERCPDRVARHPRRAATSASGAVVGQRVDATLVQGFAGHDTWNAMIHHIAAPVPGGVLARRGLADEGASVPNNSLFFRLLVALSADGRWLQFSQTTPRLFEAFMRVRRARLDVRATRSGRPSPTSTTSSSAPSTTS